MRRWASLSGPAEIARVRSQGRRRSRNGVTVWTLPVPGPSRAVMAVPVRPWGHVTRNRVRRQLRSVLDDVLAAEGLHVMVSVRGSEEPPSFVVLREALVSALVPAGGRVE